MLIDRLWLTLRLFSVVVDAVAVGMVVVMAVLLENSRMAVEGRLVRESVEELRV